MATRTVSNAGGNWNAVGTWTGGVVPIAGDDIAFTATSGNLTVNINTAGLVGVNFTNYVGTITFNNTLNTSGVLNLGTGGYTQAGASGIVLNGTATLTSGGVTWSRTLAFGGTSATYTFVGNWTSTGTVTFQGTGTTTLTNNTLNINGSLTQGGGAGIYTGTTAIVFGGTGTWSNSSTGAIRNNVIINTPSTLTMSGNLYYDTGIFTYTAGTVVTTGSTLNVAAATTFNTGTLNWNNFTTTGATYTITLSSNLNITGTLTLNHTGTLSFTIGAFSFNPTGTLVVSQGTTTIPNTLNVTNATLISSSTGAVLNTNTINISGNLSTTGTGNCTGTTSLVLTGTGTWNNTSTGTIRNNLTINAGANTITVSGNVRHDTGTLTYTSGIVDTTGSTLNIGANTTLTTNGITWNNITTNAASIITLGSNLTLTGNFTLGSTSTTSFVLGGNTFVTTNANLVSNATGTFTVPTNLTFKSLTVTNGSAFNGNTLTFTENLTINTSGCTGTTNFIYAGTGTWTASGTNCFIRNNLTINTPGGTLTLSGTPWKETGFITYTAGTFDETSAYLVVGGAGGNTNCNLGGYTFNKLLVNGAITLVSNINATTFGTADLANAPISFTLGIYSLNFTHLQLRNYNTTTLPTAWVAQNVELVAASSATLNANSITITGNFTQSGNGLFTGTTTFTYAVPALSTGTWSRTGPGRLSNNFTINSAGTINFTGGNIGGGIFTYTAGTVNVQVGSTLYNSASGTIFNGAGITWYNVVFGSVTGLTAVTSVTLNTQLICLDTLTLQVSVTTFLGTDGTFDTYNLIMGSDAAILRTTTLVSTKTYRVRQSFTSTQATDANRILLKSSIGGSRAIFTLDSGSTIDVGFVNATDIDSSLGRPIYSYKGVFTNTLNWGLLPTDNTRSSRSTFVG